MALGGSLVGCSSKQAAPPAEGGGGRDGGEDVAPVQCQRPAGDKGLSAEQRARFYHLSQGSELFGLPFLRALASAESTPERFESFLARPERFGLLPDASDPEGLPVGMSLLPADARHPMARVGFTCAACHVGELRSGGQVLRLDGAPGTFQLGLFLEAAGAATRKAFLDPRAREDFLVSLAVELRRAQRQVPTGPGTPVEGRALTDEELVDVLREAYPDSHLDSAGPSGARARLAQEVARYFHEVFPQRKAPTDAELFTFVNALSQQRIRGVGDALDVTWGHLMGLRRFTALKDLPTTVQGPGRTDAFGSARDLVFGAHGIVPLLAPVRYPPLWDLPARSWYQYDGNTTSLMQRNVGEALGVGAVFDPQSYESTLQARQLVELEQLASRLEPPCWPEALYGRLDPASVQRGAELFTQECARCHTSVAGTLVPVKEVGTDALRLETINTPLGGGVRFIEQLQQLLQRVEERACAREGLSVETDAERGPPLWRSTWGYVARPLAGVWASAPYLHNGSVPTLWDLLQPAPQRPRHFAVGHRDFDPVNVGYTSEGSGPVRFDFDVTQTGNSNAGHEYGTGLTDAQKRDLIEYLKSL